MPKTMTIAELKRQIAAMERRVARLLAKRAKLAKQLADVDRQIVELGGEVPKVGGPRRKAAPARRRRRLPKNIKPLADYIKEALAKAKDGMRVKDVQAAVKKAGYKTFSKDFYGVVATALREGPFVKVSRGVYTLKAAKKARARKTTTEA